MRSIELMRYFRIMLACALPAGAAAASREAAAVQAIPPDTLMGLPLVFQEDFEKGWKRWEIFDSASWKLTSEGANTYLQVPQLSAYVPPVRGPFNRALIKGLQVRDFVIEARVRITEPYRGHRGGMFFFGYQDPSHLYYTHFAQEASDRSNLFGKVVAAPRFTFIKTRTNGIPWTLGWQTIRMVRRFKEGVLEAYVDDMTKPVLVADDRTYSGTVYLYDSVVAFTGKNTPVAQTDRMEWGRVGIGSFQGTMDYDDVRVWAETKDSPTAIPDRSRPSRAIRAGHSAVTLFPSGRRIFSAVGRLEPVKN